MSITGVTVWDTCCGTRDIDTSQGTDAKMGAPLQPALTKYPSNKPRCYPAVRGGKSRVPRLSTCLAPMNRTRHRGDGMEPRMFEFAA
jgi:hypothetical protein